MLCTKASKLQPVFSRGYKITGRWELNSYQVVKPLGQGGTGLVYLVKDQNGVFRAMKISPDVTAITHEHRVMVFLNHCDRIKELGVVPQVYELDDFQVGRTVYHYIVIQYCTGINLGRCLQRMNSRDVILIGQQVAEFLSRLHDQGLIFGDLKPANIIYDSRNRKVSIVDYGSVSLKGHSLKQYTPGYDRASWQVGSRVGDEGYDVFALGVLLTALAAGKRDLCLQGGLPGLIKLVKEKVRPMHLQKSIIKALKQESTEGREIARQLLEAAQKDQAAERGKKTGIIVNVVGAVSILSFILGLAYYYQ